jgi:glycosyltransferase involved in cell wall biosynthesis
MKFMINAANLTESGARSVALNFLKAHAAGEWGDDLVVYAPPGRGYEELAGPRTAIRTLPPLLRSPVPRYLASGRWWRRMVRDERPDALFNMGNCAVPASVPQATLFHWPYAIYPESEVWQRMGAKDWMKRRCRRLLLRRYLPFTSIMIAQTETAASRLRRLYVVREVRVVPNAVSLQDTEAADGPLPALGPRGSRTRLLCFSRYNPHKNLEILVPVAERLKRAGAPFQIILTVGMKQHDNVKGFIERIERKGLTDYLRNIGPVAMRDVPRLYASVDALLFPTLLESFSQTYVEAMHFGKPIFTSDLDFAHDVCGDAAFFFDPRDPEAIVRTLTAAYEDRSELRACVERGRRRVAKMPDWPSVARMFVDILHEVAAGHPSCCEKELIA